MERDKMTGDTWGDIDLLCDALTKMAEAATSTAEAISKAFSYFGSFMLGESLRRYATDRQWYLMNHHKSPRVRKKWRNALLRRARIEGKRRKNE